MFVKAITVFVAVLMAFNLQIGKIHTYYAGATPERVHNACSLQGRDAAGKFTGAGGYRKEAEARGLAGYADDMGVAVLPTRCGQRCPTNRSATTTDWSTPVRTPSKDWR